MKIYPGSEIKPIVNVQKKPPSDPSEKTSKVNEGDKVAFSTQLQQVQDMKNHPSDNSDRQVRIQEVKKQIANGTYAPDSKKVAESILKYVVKENSDG